MDSLYNVIAGGCVPNMTVLQSNASQLRINKNLLVNGVYPSERFNGENFNWAGENLEFYSSREYSQDVYICIRIDFLDVDTINSRFIHSKDSMSFSLYEEFKFGKASYMVLKSNASFSQYGQVTFKTQVEAEGARRVLSIPISRVLLTPLEFKQSKQELLFALITGVVSRSCDIFPNSLSADSVADYFISVSKEFGHE
ncbi:hypothetical protein [Alteromonas portus]|uniref:hypothetical protein n=1 Tax=Alteromonas portus TaxID=2565549 RepID=UPI003BF883C1